MKHWLRKKLFKWVLWFSNKYASSPEQKRVFEQLSHLYSCILEGKQKKGLIIPFTLTDKFIVFSDQHKGAKNGADDFMLCEPNYLAALNFYNQENYFLIALGDCEELWENSLTSIKKHQQKSFEAEKKFIDRNAFIKIFGNHDLYWSNDPFASYQLKEIYGVDVPVYEGAVLQTYIGDQLLNIFCTHGHQGDKVVDGNWLSKFFISKIWAPLQAFTKINPNTPAYDAQLKSQHNSMMYEWSSQQQNTLLITGHTHQPVFESLTHIERLYRKLSFAEEQKDVDSIQRLKDNIKKLKFEFININDNYSLLKSTYFNSGCCCFNDGDITGIEIADGNIRLVKWHADSQKSQRIILEEKKLGL